MPEYKNTEMFNLIDEYIHHARDRRVMKDRLINDAPDEETRREIQRLIDKM